jgi:two-component system CheB/CheR fusion protein
MSTKPIVTIVDDDTRNCFALGAVLEHAGFECESFQNGADFLASYAPRAGCILLDIYMPGMDGLEVLREIRSRQWQTPVITFSYSPFDRLIERGREAGALACLIRPVCGDELVRAVTNALVIDAWQRREQAWRRAAHRFSPSR